MKSMIFAAILGAAIMGAIASLWDAGAADPGCTALLAHPTGDRVASRIDGTWIDDEGQTVEVDQLTRIMVPKGCD